MTLTLNVELHISIYLCLKIYTGVYALEYIYLKEVRKRVSGTVTDP